MFKFIKWELRDYAKKRMGFGIGVLVIYLLAFILMRPGTSDGLMSLIAMPFMIVMFAMMVMVFIEGTRVIINTYRKKTFLLESMIAYSPAKLLLAKYLLAIILDIVYAILMFLGFVILISMAEANVLEVFAELFEMIELNMLDVFKIVLYIFVSAVEFTALVVFSYILAKSITKSNKGSILLGVGIWWGINYIVSRVLSSIVGSNLYYYGMLDNSYYIPSMAIFIGLILVSYLATVKLIKEKLEVYN